jgi:hypothetical protein
VARAVKVGQRYNLTSAFTGQVEAVAAAAAKEKAVLLKDNQVHTVL